MAKTWKLLPEIRRTQQGMSPVCPSQEVVTGFSSALQVGDNEARTRLAQLHPLGHLGRDGDIADAIVFLASDKSAFMTGSEVVVDGGFTAQ